MSFRFLHSSDLHLGRAFGRLPEDIRGRLREARHGAIARLATAARSHGAGHVLLAGDTFDAETPAPATLRQALAAMGQHDDIRWLLLPGNHDSLAAGELWRAIAADAPDNVTALTGTPPLPLSPVCQLLCAPCPSKRPGRDVTEALSAPTPEGVVRLGLAHGGVTEFGSETGDPALVPPDRAARSGLDYLALGDWHGRVTIEPRTWYSGTPEADGFKHAATGAAGTALIVTLAAPGALPEVQVVLTGALTWADVTLDLLPGDDVADRVRAALPAAATRRDTLMRLRATGRLSLPGRSALEAATDAAAPDFGHFEARTQTLEVEAEAADLDLVATGGALRQAADALWSEARDPQLSAGDRAVAAAALARLFAFAVDATT